MVGVPGVSEELGQAIGPVLVKRRAFPSDHNPLLVWLRAGVSSENEKGGGEEEVLVFGLFVNT